MSWSLRPAWVFAVFVAARLLVAVTTNPEVLASGSQAAHAQSRPMRVVAQIPVVQVNDRVAVPKTEAELVDLLAGSTTVVFFAHEVESLGTASREFNDVDAGVIRGTIKLRKAQLRR